MTDGPRARPPWRVPSKDYARQYAEFLPELLAEFGRVLTTDEPILGAAVADFEQRFADWCGARFGVGTGSGTDAIQIALRALGVGPGDEVVMAANTFVATVTATALAGARPVLVDPDPDTMNLTAGAAQAALTPRTRAIAAVHLYGRLCPMAELSELARARGLLVIEDAAQAHGARAPDGRRAGSFGAAGCFSFHPSKILGAFGDGGIITTSDPEVAAEAARIRHLGKVTKYDVRGIGPNSKLDTLQAALLRLKLPRVDGWIERHRAIAARYRERLAGVGDLILPADPGDESHVYHLFVVRTDQRDALRAWLKQDGINAGLHYPRPPHLQELGLGWPYRKGSFPVAERLARTVLSLPTSRELADAEIDAVADSIRRFFAGGGAGRAR